MLVHPSSKIDASNWVSKTSQCVKVPAYFTRQITRDDNFIVVPDPFHFPADVDTPFWLEDWLSGFDGWVVTTGLLDIKVTTGDPQGTWITGDIEPDIANDESIESLARVALHGASRTLDDFEFEYGYTMENDRIHLKSGHRLIVIVDRVTLHHQNTVKQYQRDDSRILETWFHETACHAGRENQGEPFGHGDVTVDSHAMEIEQMFMAADITTTRVAADIETFLASQRNIPKP